MTATITGTENYAGASKYKEFEILKANNTVSISIPNNWVYGDVTAVTVSGLQESPTITYKYSIDSGVTYTSDTPKDVDTYMVKATSSATDNYNITSATESFNITGKVLTPTIVVSTFTKTYDGIKAYSGDIVVAANYTLVGLETDDTVTLNFGTVEFNSIESA